MLGNKWIFCQGKTFSVFISSVNLHQVRYLDNHFPNVIKTAVDQLIKILIQVESSTSAAGTKVLEHHLLEA